MSMILMAQAMKLKIGNSARKFVLIKLADNANDKGECWPSYQHIADHCELGRSTVKAHIDALVDSGFVRKFERNNGKSSNKYVLTLESGTQKERVKPNRNGNLAQPLTGSTAGTSCTAADTPLAQPLAPEPIIDPIKEPITITSPTGSTAPEGADSVCSVCHGAMWFLSGGRPVPHDMEWTESMRDCNHCNGTGKEPTCNDGLQVVNSELTTDKPKAPADTAEQVGQTEHEAAPADKPVKTLNIPFDDFWSLYNKKVDRKKAEAKWKRLTNKDREAVMAALPAYIRNTPDVQYRKNPVTYLNNESWNDEIPQTGRNLSYPAQSVPRNNDPDTPVVPKTIQRQAMSDEEIARQKAELANVLKGVE